MKTCMNMSTSMNLTKITRPDDLKKLIRTNARVIHCLWVFVGEVTIGDGGDGGEGR